MVSSTFLAYCLTTTVLSLKVPTVYSTSFHRPTTQNLHVQLQPPRGGGDGDDTVSNPSNNNNNAHHHSSHTLELRHVQIIHRHGDRTPITPMSDIDFWKETLPPPTILEQIAQGTTMKRKNDDNSGSGHAAAGIGPFGKLTQLGLLQMVQVGSQLLEELSHSEEKEHETQDDDALRYLFTKTNPIHPSKIKVISTDFPRTIQSVQALLVGLFPDGLSQYDDIEIDGRYTSQLIPDPQPRLSKEQIQLEFQVSQRPHLQQRETELQNLAMKLTNDLSHFINDSVDAVVFGIGEEMEQNGRNGKPLAWIQLVEIMKCLKVRNLLPESITEEEYDIASSHVAWKWFESLKDERLAQLAMKPFMNFIIDELIQAQKRGGERGSCDDGGGETESGGGNNEEEETVLTIYSCHDSSLIGLISAFRLEQPSKWPE